MQAFYSKIGMPLWMRKIEKEDIGDSLKGKLNAVTKAVLLGKAGMVLVTGMDMKLNASFIKLLIDRLYKKNGERYESTYIHVPESIEDMPIVANLTVCLGLNFIPNSTRALANLAKLVTTCLLEERTMLFEAPSEALFRGAIGEVLYDNLVNYGMLRVEIPTKGREAIVL